VSTPNVRPSQFLTGRQRGAMQAAETRKRRAAQQEATERYRADVRAVREKYDALLKPASDRMESALAPIRRALREAEDAENKATTAARAVYHAETDLIRKERDAALATVRAAHPGVES